MQIYIKTRRLNRFLASRCEKKFIEFVTDKDSTFYERLNVGPYFYAVSDVDVITTLYKHNLLPEKERQRHIFKIVKLAIATPDAGILRDDIRELFTEEEFQQAIQRIRTELILKLQECITNWKLNYDRESDPEDYFWDLKSTLSEYKGGFGEDGEAISLLDVSIGKIDEIISEIQAEIPEKTEDNDYYRGDNDSSTSGTSRSIFDDVDQ